MEDQEPGRRFIAKLREADVLVGQGREVAEVIKALGVIGVTRYRWRLGYGRMSVPQARRRQPCL